MTNFDIQMSGHEKRYRSEEIAPPIEIKDKILLVCLYLSVLILFKATISYTVARCLSPCGEAIWEMTITGGPVYVGQIKMKH